MAVRLPARLRPLALRHRRAVIAALHLALVAVSNYAAFWLRFEGSIPAHQMDLLVSTLPVLLVTRAVLFVPFHLYHGLWKYTSIPELCHIVCAVLSSTVLFAVVLRWGLGATGYSRSVLLIDSMLLVVLLSGVRLSRRVIEVVRRRKGGKRVLIFGAGEAGAMIVRDMRVHPCGYEPLGFIDDNPAKIGQHVQGVKVLGSRRDLARIVARQRPHEILVAMPGAEPSAVRGVFETLRPIRLPITTLPGTRDILEGRVEVRQIRQLTIADLLPRAPVDLDPEPVRGLVTGRRVLITGAGGSIGSELSRQIAALEPASLVLLERYENSLYELASELVDRSGDAAIRPVIGDVTDAKRMAEVFAENRPHLVFHAAAHKHVPMMECHPCEAVKNNVAGTATVARAADEWGAERFILISTDKAVNPTSVMGATKHVGELIQHTMSRRSFTRFAAVRFGNVLGSNGSVLPRFLEQIRAGGPVTVTHPEIRRFFMLIPEAVQLVLHAATLGEPGMVYVLEMGEQIRLVDMARNIIRCAGFVPDEEIPIAFVGLRPGEKLFEELIGPGELAEPSPVPKVLRVRTTAAGRDWSAVECGVERLVALAQRGETEQVLEHLHRMVPTFRTAGEPGPNDVPTLGRMAALAPQGATVL